MKENINSWGEIINNINAKWNTSPIITNTNPKSTISKVNNNIDDEIDAGAFSTLNILGAIIINIDVRSISSKSHNYISNEIDISILNRSNMANKNMDTEPIASRAINNINVKVDINILMNETIQKMNMEFTVSGLHRANIIVKKKVYKFNLFWLLLTFNRNLISKIMPSRPLLFKPYFILINY